MLSRSGLFGHYLVRITGDSLGTGIEVLILNINGMVSEVGHGELLNRGHLCILVQVEDNIRVSGLGLGAVRLNIDSIANLEGGEGSWLSIS
jgi:hypothetical protein